MKEDYITFTDKATKHKNFHTEYKKYQLDKALTDAKIDLENKINNLIYEFESKNLGIRVDFEQSNITKPYPSKERMNMYLFIDLDTLLPFDNE